MAKTRARSGSRTTPDVLAALAWRPWLREVVATRRRRSPLYSLERLARAARASASRLCAAMEGEGPLFAEDRACLSRHLGHTPEQERFFALLVAMDEAEDNAGRRRALDGLVAIHHERALAEGRGAAFRARSRWPHVLGAAWLRGGGDGSPEALAMALGVPVAVASEVLADLAALSPADAPPETVMADARSDHARQVLMDDLLLLGMRAMEQRPEAGRFSFSHLALPLSVTAGQTDRLTALHSGEPVTSEPAPGQQMHLLLTHSAPITRPFPASRRDERDDPAETP